jgi:hypothetical protein
MSAGWIGDQDQRLPGIIGVFALGPMACAKPRMLCAQLSWDER